MRISDVYSRTVIVFALLCLGVSTADRTKRQIVFENDDDNSNGLFDSDCTTPDRRPGRCLRLASCTALSQGLSGNRLRRYVCGFEGSEPRVCCPQPRTEGTTRRPTPRTAVPTPRPDVATPRPVVATPRPVVATPRPVRITPRPPRPTPNPNVDISRRIIPNVGDRPSFLPLMCGVSLFTTQRIIGGREAESGSWPWMAVIYFRQSNGRMRPDCGGALVTNQHIVTAAHCVVGRGTRPIEASRLRVRLGAHDLKIDNEPGSVEVGVEAVRRHEQFDPRTYRNDIAVLKLSQPVRFTDRIRPVCLPYDSLRDEDLEGRSAFAIGYGTTAFNGNSSDVLMEVSFDILDQDTCRESFRREVRITSVYMCAGRLDGTKDACQGDSGGPLMTVGDNKSYYLVGIVSFGKSCGRPGYPGVYTRVTEFLDWLTRNLAD